MINDFLAQQCVTGMCVYGEWRGQKGPINGLHVFLTPCVQCHHEPAISIRYANHVVARIRMIIIMLFHWSHMNFGSAYDLTVYAPKNRLTMLATPRVFVYWTLKIWAKHSNTKCAIFRFVSFGLVTAQLNHRYKKTHFAQFSVMYFRQLPTLNTAITSIFDMLCSLSFENRQTMILRVRGESDQITNENSKP